MSDHFQDLYFKRTVGLDNEKISCYNPLSGGSCNQQYIIETEDSSNFAEEEVNVHYLHRSYLALSTIFFLFSSKIV